MAQRLSLSNKQKVLLGAGIILGIAGIGIGFYQSRKDKKKLRQRAVRQTTKQ